MKILMASTPATGHLNPLLAIGHILIAEGHEVVGLSGSVLRERIENIGAEIRPFPRARISICETSCRWRPN
jgi:UDP:flavonoid glycosyltransferase YjiC (YdhE family)